MSQINPLDSFCSISVLNKCTATWSWVAQLSRPNRVKGERWGGGGYFNIWAIGSVCAVEGTTVPDMSPAVPYYLQTIK